MMYFKIGHFYKQTQLSRAIAVIALFILLLIVGNCAARRDNGEKILPNQPKLPKEQQTMQIN